MTDTETNRRDRTRPTQPSVKDSPKPSGSERVDEAPSVDAQTRRWWRSRRGVVLLSALIAVLAIAAVVVALITQANSRPAADPVAVTVPVALTDVKAPADVKIGIVLTLGQSTAEGAEWASAAQGAEVAKYRLALGGTKISFEVEDDHGTAAGSRDAVTNLAKKDVAGIVIASSGPHIADATQAASKAGIPVVLPYAPIPAGTKNGVWSLTSTDNTLATAMNTALEKFTHPILLNVGGDIPSGLSVSETLQSQDADLSAFAAKAAARTDADPTANGVYSGGQTPTPAPATEAPRADALVITGTAGRMAELVAALQARQVTVPILLTPAAASPVFAQTLNANGGTISSGLSTFGVSAGDSTALRRDNTARATSAFLQALGQLASDNNAMNLTNDASFAQVASSADSRAHDAVLALVYAAASANSADPARVSESLGSLKLGASDGIAGPVLNFRTANASDIAERLYATGQSLGLRPASSDTIPLAWFPAPDKN